MIVFPNAKINIGLHITEKREDGYHNLETIFLPIKNWFDSLEVISANEDIFTTSGLLIDGSKENNLCLKALRKLREVAEIPPIHTHLHKALPFGAGLGGGSADAAFMINLLNTQFNLKLSCSERERIASEIGADCAFFIRNRAAYATGIGEQLSSVQINLSDYWIHIVVPPIHVATAKAFADIKPHKRAIYLPDEIQKPLSKWKETIQNDFEKSVFKAFPSLREIKENLYKQGALFASLSGSGSALFGLFKQEPSIQWPQNFCYHSEQMKDLSF